MPNETDETKQPAQIDNLPESQENEKPKTQFVLDMEVAKTVFERREAIFTQLTSETTALRLRVDLLSKNVGYDKLRVSFKLLLEKIKDILIELDNASLTSKVESSETATFSERKQGGLSLLRDKARSVIAMRRLLSLFSILSTVASKQKGDNLDNIDIEIQNYSTEKLSEFQSLLSTAITDVRILLQRYSKFFEAPFEETVQYVSQLQDKEALLEIKKMYGDEEIFDNLGEVLPEDTNTLTTMIQARRLIVRAIDARLRKLAEQSTPTL